MSVLIVPPPDLEPWPTLGPQVVAWMEAYLVHGPGDLRKHPYRLDAEKKAVIYKAYEVFPSHYPEWIGEAAGARVHGAKLAEGEPRRHPHAGEPHPQAGRRRFRRVGISWRKGTAKTEFAAAIAAAELHPDGPVRCDGFDAAGQPVGRGVTDPYIPMVAYTEEQTEELAYAALKVMLEEGPLARDFDIGLARILRRDGAGKAEALASSPNARDGARTTFQHFDETHRFTLPSLRDTHKVMQANLAKRYAADPWSLETTTAFEPGARSVAEGTFHYAQAVARGTIKDSRLFYFHRQAAEDAPLETREQIRAAVVEASGPSAEWSDIDGIVDQFEEPDADRNYLERVWLNRPARGAERAFDARRWAELARSEVEIAAGELITLGFDGSRHWDATALVATHVATGYQWPLAIWERPPTIEQWEVPADEVDAAIQDAFSRWTVWRLYADPPYWESYVAKWSGEYGAERVISWWTNRRNPMAYAIRTWHNALIDGELTHGGEPRLAALLDAHVANCCRVDLTVRTDEGREERLFLIYKERRDSPKKIDGAMAAILSWEARRDAIAAGVLRSAPPSPESVYETRGILHF